MAGVTICSDFGAQENKSVTALLPLFPYLFSHEIMELNAMVLVFWMWHPVNQSCLTLCDPLNNSPPGSSVHGIFQTRILEWDAISSFKESSWPMYWPHICSVSCIGRQILYHCAPWEGQLNVELKPIFSRSSFTFIKRLFSSSSLSVMSGIICLSEVIDISPGNHDSSLCFIQPSILHDVLCI